VARHIFDEELSAFARDKLAGYKIPLRLEFVDALPRNPAGKVLKYQLLEQLITPPEG
jgi:fatty-acyl-CoA synthase